MDFNTYNSLERSSLINELTQGMEVAKQLKAHMGPEYPVETQEMLLQQIVSSYDKAFFILGLAGAAEQPHQLLSMPLPVMPSTPLSTLESPKSEDLQAALDFHHDSNESSKKRKAASKWTKQVKVNCGSIQDGPPPDGHSWRKYGQKDILGAKHSRSYYRCTYRSVQDCWATKQVQRSDDDPMVLHITYKGKHTCTIARRSKSAPTSPGTEENKPHDPTIMEYQQHCTMALNFQNAIGADTQCIGNNPFASTELGYLIGENPSILPSTVNCTNNFYGSFSSSIISPSTSGSNYFSISPRTMETFGTVQNQHQNLERDITEMLSAATSATNSPAIEPDFSLHQGSFSQKFSFNNP